MAFEGELQMKGFRARLGEFWNGEVAESTGPMIYEKKQPTAKIVKSTFSHERPAAITFERLMKYHDLTPQIQVAVSSYAELITGTDMVVNTEDVAAKDFLEEWIRQTGFYDKFEGMVATLLITGNALLEKLDAKDIEDVEEVDMTSIISKERDEFGKLQYYEQRQQGGAIVKIENIDDFIEFNLTHYSKQAWGRSLFYSLAVPRTTGYRTTAPLVEIMWGIEDAMAGILQNNAYPITTITYPGANDEYLEKEAERWRRYKPGDKRVQKIKPEIEFFETNPASKYTDYINHLEKTVELGTQFPHDIMTGDFTSRASSETTETIVMKKIRGFQRYLCNKLKKELFEPILEQQGFNMDEVELEVSFTTQNIVELEPDKVKDLFQAKILSLKEVRDWYAENTGMELEESEMAELEKDKEEDKQMQQQKMDKSKKAFGEKLKLQDKSIDELKQKLLLRENADRKSEKAKMFKEIVEDIKNL